MALTESAFAGEWARRLVERFVEGGADWSAWLADARARWLDGVVLPEPKPWFVEEGLARGAFATFLGIRLIGRSAEAVAVGDSCLFLIRDDDLRRAFPLNDPAAFDNTPPLIGSRAAPRRRPAANAEPVAYACVAAIGSG